MGCSFSDNKQDPYAPRTITNPQEKYKYKKKYKKSQQKPKQYQQFIIQKKEEKKQISKLASYKSQIPEKNSIQKAIYHKKQDLPPINREYKSMYKQPKFELRISKQKAQKYLYSKKIDKYSQQKYRSHSKQKKQAQKSKTPRKKQKQKYPEKDIQKQYSSVQKMMDFDRLLKIQQNFIKQFGVLCKKMHESFIQTIKSRFKNLGYKQQQIKTFYYYIKLKAPIIIHVHLNTALQFFIKDTHYRSQFQTGTSSGMKDRKKRIQWQDRIFNNHYKNATDFQRVKYGTINLTGDTKGVSYCSGYGKSYFVLKYRVRPRCTFTDMDSSLQNCKIGTLKYCYNVICRFSDIQLKATMQAALGNVSASNCLKHYKQIQIHGPVRFNKDIYKVVVSRSQIPKGSTNQNMLNTFLKTNNNLQAEYID